MTHFPVPRLLNRSLPHEGDIDIKVECSLCYPFYPLHSRGMSFSFMFDGSFSVSALLPPELICYILKAYIPGVSRCKCKTDIRKSVHFSLILSRFPPIKYAYPFSLSTYLYLSLFCHYLTCQWVRLVPVFVCISAFMYFLWVLLTSDFLFILAYRLTDKLTGWLIDFSFSLRLNQSVWKL